MLTDPTGSSRNDERSPVLAALAYLCDPEDVIPDEIPGIGLLDDAVMIELVFRELRHELEAYEDFRAVPPVAVARQGACARTRSCRRSSNASGVRRMQLMARHRDDERKSVR